VADVGVYITGRRLSGVVWKGVLVRDWDEAETRLPVEELLLMVSTGVTVSGIELTTCCFGRLPASGRVSCATRPSGGGSEGLSAEPRPVVNMPPLAKGRQKPAGRELSVRPRASALW
jgi:hypothetical protein